MSIGTDAETKKKIIAEYATAEGDPVARLHLDNGARLERLNAHGNMSAKGLKQSFGVMVNYLYDLPKIEENHDAYFDKGKIACSRAVNKLLD